MLNPSRVRELARHALGLPNDRNRSYRNDYAAARQTTSERAWLRMVANGDAAFVSHGVNNRFKLTNQGALSALDPNESLCPEDFPDVLYPVFVYGTLKRGHGNHRILQSAAASFIGEAFTCTPFYLFGNGVPFACREGEKLLPIVGELYLASQAALPSLDGLEGTNRGGYDRTWTNVRFVSHPRLPAGAAFIYSMRGSRRSGAECPVIDGRFVWRP